MGGVRLQKNEKKRYIYTVYSYYKITVNKCNTLSHTHTHTQHMGNPVFGFVAEPHQQNALQLNQQFSFNLAIYLYVCQFYASTSLHKILKSPHKNLICMVLRPSSMLLCQLFCVTHPQLYLTLVRFDMHMNALYLLFII